MAMRRMVSWCLALWLTWAGGAAAGGATTSPLGTSPEISIAHALEMAQAHARERGVDLGGQYVHAARLEYDDGSRIYPDGKRRQGRFWYIHWLLISIVISISGSGSGSSQARRG